jgi:WD40 repeat protein
MTTTARTTAPARTAVTWRATIDDAPVAVAVGGHLLAVGGAAGTAWVLDPADGSPAATVTLPGGLLDLAFSPGGGHLLLTGPEAYGLWHSGEDRATVLVTGRWSARARWSGPDRVAIADGRTAVVLDAAGRELWRTEQALSTVTDLAWLRDGRRLAVSAYNGVRCHERHRLGPVASYGYPGSHLAVAAPPDGRWICTGNQDTSIHIWRTRDAAELTMSGYPGKVSRLAFDDTGRWLASDGSPEVTVWDFAGTGPEGRAPRMLAAHEAVTALAWRPGNDAVLATAGAEGTVALWDAAAGRPGSKRTSTARWELGDGVTAMAWNGSGMLLATTRDGTVHALDPAGH